MWKIIYARAYTYEHQYNLLLGLAAKMSEEPYRLLVSFPPSSFKVSCLRCLHYEAWYDEV
jgi:hypothetical protein